MAKKKPPKLTMGPWQTSREAPIPLPSKALDDELDHINRNLDVEDLVLDIVGSRIWDIDVREICLRAEIVDVMKGSPSLELDLWDPDGDLRTSGRLNRTIDIHIGGGRWYRLADIKRGEGGVLTLIFESKWTDRLKRKMGPMKQARSKGTRAEFILAAINKVAKGQVTFICPELKKKQPLETKDKEKKKKKKKERKEGFGPGDKKDIQVKKADADSSQIDNIDRVLTTGRRLGASDKVMIGSIETITQESDANRFAENGQFKGLFQQSKAYGWPASMNPEKDAAAWFAKAMKIDKQLPQTKASIIARKVQMNNLPAYMPPTVQDFEQWADEAENTYNLWKGGTSVTTSKEYYKKYEFEIAEDQNFWDGILELADEVKWAIWINKNTIWYMSEEDLYKSAHRGRIRDGEDGVLAISWDKDDHKRVNEATVTADMDRWVAPIGSIVVLDNEGPANGRWLVTEIRKSLFDWTGKMTLEQPTHSDPEPRPTLATQTTTSQRVDDKDIEGMSPKELIDKVVLPMARDILGISISAESVWEANDRHNNNVAGTSNQSWHKGPPSEKWAADMSNGGSPTRQMDKLAKELAKVFKIPWSGSGAVTKIDGANGFIYNMLYRTNIGGNHYNHVHFGAKALSPNKGGKPPPGTTKKPKNTMAPGDGPKKKPPTPTKPKKPKSTIPDFQ